MTKQDNIEAIVDRAYEVVSGFETCADGDISREWMHRFIDEKTPILFDKEGESEQVKR